MVIRPRCELFYGWNFIGMNHPWGELFEGEISEGETSGGVISKGWVILDP